MATGVRECWKHTFVKDNEGQTIHADKCMAKGIKKYLIGRDYYTNAVQDGLPDPGGPHVDIVIAGQKPHLGRGGLKADNLDLLSA